MNHYIKMLLIVVLVFFSSSAEAMRAQTALEGGNFLGAEENSLAFKLRSKTTRDGYINSMLDIIKENSRSKTALEKSDIENYLLSANAEQRARKAAEILNADLNADMAVSEQELREYMTIKRFGPDSAVRFSRSEQQPLKMSRYERMMLADSNKDGIIDMREMLYIPETQYEANYYRRYGAKSLLMGLLALDPNKDGKLSTDELRQLAQIEFDSADMNKDGTISEDEYLLYQYRSPPNPSGLPVDSSRYPAEGETLVHLDTIMSETYADTTILGENKLTYTVRVHIEDGKEPLYLVLSSPSSCIWQIEGATERVQYALLAHFSGVTGLKSDKVGFSSKVAWRYYQEAKRTSKADEEFEKALGKRPDISHFTRAAESISIPSGIESHVVPNDNSEKYLPGGMVTIDAAAVVSIKTAKKYDIFPSYTGLTQLISKGKLEKLVGKAYKIIGNIEHFPAGLTGANSVDFVLGKGVKVPAGDPGTGCIISEETGNNISYNNCQ